MNDLLKIAQEFLETADESFKKERYNVAVSDYITAIIILSKCSIKI